MNRLYELYENTDKRGLYTSKKELTELKDVILSLCNEVDWFKCMGERPPAEQVDRCRKILRALKANNIRLGDDTEWWYKDCWEFYAE